MEVPAACEKQRYLEDYLEYYTYIEGDNPAPTSGLKEIAEQDE